MKYVFVHGRSQEGKDPESLKQTWIDSLQEGLKNCRLDMAENAEYALPFYGDRLHTIAKTRGSAMPGTDNYDPYQTFEAEILAEIAQNTNIAEPNAATNNTRGPANWEWVQMIARILDRRFPVVADGTLNRVTHDVFLYLTDQTVRQEINSLVDAAIPHDENVLVVAHSLGTIVAFDVLKNRPLRASNTISLVTIGSPLGLRAVSTRLAPICNPASSRAWFNAYDERDVVALNPLNGTYFDVDPPIENDPGVDNDTQNRHGITGYLNDPVVARKIHELAANL